jgi:asparaginyl-tRNA synthetase
MLTIANLLANPPVGETVDIAGWLRTRRDTGSFSFLEINDGSCLANLQIIADDRLANYQEEVKKLTWLPCGLPRMKIEIRRMKR